MLGKIRWTIAMKVGSTIAMLIIFILGLLIHSIFAIGDIQSDLQEIADLDVPLTIISNEIEITQLELHIEMDKILRKSSLKTVRGDLNQSRIEELGRKVFKLMDKGISFAEKGVKTGKDGSVENFYRISNTLYELKEEFSTIYEALIQLIKGLSFEKHFNAELVSSILNKDEQFDKKAISLIKAIEALTVRKAHLAVKHQQMFKVVNISLGIIGVSLGILLGTLIVAGIKANILRLSKRMEEVTSAIIENRQIPPEEVGSRNSSDELGMLSNGLSKLIDSLSADMSKRDKLSKRLYELATIDHLTKSFNRFKWDKDCRSEIERSKRTSSYLSLIFFDIDHFKRVNDTFGHDVGDTTLIDVVRVASDVIRNVDSLYRIGGEEFAVLLPDTKIDDGVVLAERIRVAVENHEFDKISKLTISIGVTWFQGESDSAEQFVKRADQGLYKSKENGRNNVTSM